MFTFHVNWLPFKWNEYVSIAVNRNLSNCEKARKKGFRGFNGIRTRGLCVSAAVLYQPELWRPTHWRPANLLSSSTRERNETQNEMVWTAGIQMKWVCVHRSESQFKQLRKSPKKRISGLQRDSNPDYGLRTTGYGWTRVFRCLGYWAEYATNGAKYKVKIADYRQQTTKKEPKQTPHYKVRLVFIFSSQKLPFEKARDTLVLLFSKWNYELSLYFSMGIRWFLPRIFRFKQMLIWIKSEQGRSSSFVDLKGSHFCLERTKRELYSRNKFYFIQLESIVAVEISKQSYRCIFRWSDS